MEFFAKLTRTIRTNNSLLCIGLDPDRQRLPAGVNVLEFNKAIIDMTSDIVCAYKPNLAFYEALGGEGYDVLKSTVDYIPKEIPVIGDAKRGDIGNTAEAYARAIFDCLGFDATTVNPYLGFDAIEPFLQYRDRGIFILCRTSNAGAVDFQSLRCASNDSNSSLFEIVAAKVSDWNIHGNLGLVVGATYPDELARIRSICPDLPLLIPGIGAQGGDLAQTVRCGAGKSAPNMIINSSRQILYGSQGKDFARAARHTAGELRDRINDLLAASSPGSG